MWENKKTVKQEFKNCKTFCRRQGGCKVGRPLGDDITTMNESDCKVPQCGSLLPPLQLSSINSFSNASLSLGSLWSKNY